MKLSNFIIFSLITLSACNVDNNNTSSTINNQHQKTNYHTHTYRCNHANGEDKEYVEAAIKNGYDLIGFSDHVMLPWTLQENSVRGRYDEIDDYFTSIRNLKLEYSNKIDILLGFECEWNEIFRDYYSNLLNKNLVDYLILGNHYLQYNTSNGTFTVCEYPATTKEYVLQYIESSITALESGLFKIFAHPDYFMSYFDNWDDDIAEKCRLMCQTAKEYNVALEINQGSFINETKEQYASYYNEPRFRYPYDKFWGIVAEVGNIVVTGVDAHDPSAFNNTNARNEAFKLAEKYNINITEELNISSKIPQISTTGHQINVINGTGSKLLNIFDVTVIKADNNDKFFDYWEVNGQKNESYPEEFVYVQYEYEEKETTFKAIYKENISSYEYVFDKTFIQGNNKFGDLIWNSNMNGTGSVESSRGARFNIADDSENNTLILKTNIPFNVNNLEISAAMGSGNNTTLSVSIGGVEVLKDITLTNTSQIYTNTCNNLTGEVIITMKATISGKTSYLKSIKLY